MQLIFNDFKIAVTKQFEKMKEHTLYRTSVSGDKLWETYLASFPEGTNPIYRERTDHDCSCCRQFIRAVGNLVANIDGTLVSIWDCEIEDVYGVVAESLSELVHSKPINNFFLHDVKKVGTDKSHEQLDDGSVMTWQHFYLELPTEYVPLESAAILSKKRAIHDVFERSLQTISIEAVDTVLELIDSKSLYRGEEHRAPVARFKELKIAYSLCISSLNLGTMNLFTWRKDALPIRNTMIGTLLVDLSEGKELEAAVGSYEAKAAPENYKRPKALSATKSQIDRAEKKVIELGFLDSLPRRYARAEDVTINNVIFADRSAKQRMGIFEELKSEVPTSINSEAVNIGITDFIKDVVPQANSMSLLMERRLNSNKVSLIAPVNGSAPSMLKWNNNFSWVYDGEVADSMKERVKAAGGKVDGVLRYSIQWNEEGDNNIDFDAHCVEPNGNLISYPKAGQTQPSSGILDVDIVNPGGKIAVENITWTNELRMQRGRYAFILHNYNSCPSRHGFTAEIEYDGKVYSYTYDKPLAGKESVVIAYADYYGKRLVVGSKIPCSSFSTAQAEKVSMIMYSPNHWDEQGVGNKHYFFMLEGMKRDGEARGFFNEFLQENLNEHRKVFEILGSKMRAPETNDQISGVGFSSTKRNYVNVIVDGKPYKVQI